VKLDVLVSFLQGRNTELVCSLLLACSSVFFRRGPQTRDMPDATCDIEPTAKPIYLPAKTDCQALKSNQFHVVSFAPISRRRGQAAGQFGTLAKALTAAGLIDTLKGPGPFTVFAPTDAAFAKIPADKLNALLADKAKLTKVLTYHVLPGKVMAADVKSGKAKTVQGQDLKIMVSGMGVKVNDATVTKTDILASNGVIHVIDRVVMPQ